MQLYNNLAFLYIFQGTKQGKFWQGQGEVTVSYIHIYIIFTLVMPSFFNTKGNNNNNNNNNNSNKQ